MDGSVTPRAEMTGKVAKWANSHAEVWQSHPVKGDVGLVFIPESELFNYVQQGSTEYYAQSIKGAYQAFFDQNILADFVALENIDEYKLIYLAYPVMLKRETAGRLKQYVQQGGTLICEGLPAYFGDHGHAGTIQPNFGLDELFGAREKVVEFDPDLSDQLMFEVKGSKIYGRYFRQDYDLLGGKAAGQYSNGNTAAVENTLGQGRTLLIGSFPGAGYTLHHGAPTRELFAGFLKLAGLTQQIAIDNPALQARLHQGAGGTHIWVTNPTRDAKQGTITLATATGQFQSAVDVWGDARITQAGRQFTMNVPARDAVVAMLR
jgi:beta-galactosidase